MATWPVPNALLFLGGCEETQAHLLVFGIALQLDCRVWHILHTLSVPQALVQVGLCRVPHDCAVSSAGGAMMMMKLGGYMAGLGRSGLEGGLDWIRGSGILRGCKDPYKISQREDD